jgi:hypothetical protein
MTAFPSEFSAALQSVRTSLPPIRGHGDPVRWFPKSIRPDVRVTALASLESELAPLLRPARRPVDPTLISGMTCNYSEALPKSLHNATVMLNDARSKAAKAARAIGLTQFLTSTSLQQFAETISGYQLLPKPGLQVIRYQPGDYVGPHNDHHPEEDHLRHGYVDLQITLSNDDVARQYLLYEKDGYFNQSVNVGIPSGISVSHLPFWHQVTPLEARPGREATACRWLLLVSFVRTP